MSNPRYARNRQLPLWDVKPATQALVTLTSEQQEELTASLAELLLLNLATPVDVTEGEQDAE
jgi:hypothetical protein